MGFGGNTGYHRPPFHPGLGLPQPTSPSFSSPGQAHLCPNRPQLPPEALPEVAVGPGQAPQHPVIPQHQHPRCVQPGDAGQQLPVPAGSARPAVQPWGPIPAGGHHDVCGPHPLLDAPFALQPGSLCLGAARGQQLVSPQRKVPLDAAVSGQHGRPGQLPVWQETLKIQGLQVCTEAQLGLRAQEEHEFLPWDVRPRGLSGWREGTPGWLGLTQRGWWFHVSHTLVS